MLSEIKFEHPTWFIILCVLLGIVFAMGLYIKDNRFNAYPAWYTWILSLLRGVVVSGLAILLLSPLVKKTTEDTKQPIIVIANDVSKSIVAEKNAAQIANLNTSIDQLEESIREKYEVKRLSIGDQATPEKTDSFTANITNLSKALAYIDENYADQNLGAVILSTDGIYNEGKNPLYTSTNISAPLYTIAQGDTTERKDLFVKNIFANKIAYLGDKFTVQIDVSARNAKGANTTLSISKVDNGNRKKLHSERINIDSEAFFTTKEITLDADKVGVNKYSISLGTITGEMSTPNNYKDVYIEVIDARQKILLLANAPHPDLSALHQIVEKNKNYEVKTAFAQSFEASKVNEYDLVVFHNLPSDKHDIRPIEAQLNARNVPTVFIVGAQTSLPKLNSVQNIIKANGNSKSLEYVNASLNDGFSSFTTSPELKRTVNRFPELLAPFGQYKALSGTEILLTQQIKDVNTNYPLLAFSSNNDRKTAVWVGEGIWKWRMFNYAQTSNFDLAEELVGKLFQYVGTKVDKRKFRATTSQTIYKENEDILFDAQLYNDNYELINDVDAFLSLRNEDEKEYKFTFSKKSDYYTLNARTFPAGKYAYTATTTFNGKTLNQKGYFSVQALQLESYDLTARHELLRSLSKKYGGTTFLPSQTPALADTLLNGNVLKPVIFSSTKTLSALNYKWIFWLLLLLLLLEWFLRRYWGSY